MYSLGNIGGAVTQCVHSDFATAETAIRIECPNETFIGSLDTLAGNTGKAVFDIGIIPGSNEDHTYCTNKALGDDNFCTPALKRSTIEADLVANCVGKQSC